jgi:hypothetical protein
MSLIVESAVIGDGEPRPALISWAAFEIAFCDLKRGRR